MALKRLILWLALCLVPAHVAAQQTSTFPTTPTSSGGGGAGYPGATVATGDITATDEVVTLTGLTNVATVQVRVTGSWVGTIFFQARASTTDTWTDEFCINPTSGSPVVTQLNSLTGDHYVTCAAAGFNEFQLIGQAWESGTASVILRGTPAPQTTYAQITNATQIPVVASISSGTGSRVRTGDWFGSAFTAGSNGDSNMTASAQLVRAMPTTSLSTGTITGSGAEVDVEMAGAATLSALWTGTTGTGNIEIQKSFDLSTWELVDTIDVAALPTTTQVYPITGWRWARAIGTTVSGADTVVSLRLTSTPTSLTVTQPTGGNLHIVCDSGCGSPPATADGTAFTAGTTSVSPIGALVDELGSTTVAEDTYGAPRMSPGRVLYVDTSKMTGPMVTGIQDINSGNNAQILNSSPSSSDYGLVVRNIPSGTQAVSGTFWQATQPVSLAAVPTHNVTNAGTFAVQVTSAPTTAVTGTFWQATQPVSGTFWQATQPISGTVGINNFPSTQAVTQGGAWSVGGGTPTNNALVNGVAVLAGRAQTVAPSFTDGNIGFLSMDTSGSLRATITNTVPVSGTFWQATQPISAASLPLPTGAATSAKQPALGTAGAASADVLTVQGIASMTALKVDGSAVTQPVSGTVTSNIGTTNGLALDATLTGGTAQTKITDGTNVATVKAASTAAAATDKALVVAVSPNNSVAVTGTFFQATQPVSGTVTANAGTGTFAVNNAQINGVTMSTGFGVSDTGSQRIVLSQEATYAASTTAKTATASGTAAFFEICGSGTKTIRIQRIAISGTAATAAYGDIQLRKTSSAGTGATSTTLTTTPFDSNSAAATATVKYNTVLPTGGNTLVGNIFSESAFFPATATVTTFAPQFIYVWRDTDAEPPTLRGAAQCITAGFGTAPGSAPTLSVSVAWTEK